MTRHLRSTHDCCLPRDDVTTAPGQNGGLILLDPRRGRLYQLNQAAALLWTALHSQHGNLDQAITTAGALLAITPDRYSTDARALVDQLTSLGLVAT